MRYAPALAPQMLGVNGIHGQSHDEAWLRSTTTPRGQASSRACIPIVTKCLVVAQMSRRQPCPDRCWPPRPCIPAPSTCEFLDEKRGDGGP